MLDDKPSMFQLLAAKKAIIIAVTAIAIPVGITALAAQSQKDSANQAAPVGTSTASSEEVSKNSGSAAGAAQAATISIPASATVLTLNGLNLNLTNYVPNQFQGIFKKSPYKIAKVDYPASFAANSIPTGVANLNAMLKSIRGPKIVLGHSQGAQVASRWMREHANDPAAPKSSELTFILTGNPLRSHGPGYIVGKKEIGGTTGIPTPTNTPWPIIDVARRYDGWADWPSNTQNTEAVSNADRGKLTVHTRYDGVNLYDKSNTVWKNGNTTYVLTKESTLPMMDGESQLPADVVAVIRARIESAYHRPPNDPKVPLKIPSDPYWSSQMQAWGLTAQ